MIKDVLTAQNRWLLVNLDKLEGAITKAAIPPELAPYHASILVACQRLRGDIMQNMRDLQLTEAAIAEEILSNTQAATRAINLMSTRLAYPILRASDADRLSLRVIGWMHRQHPETRQLPPAFCDGATAVWSFDLPIYFLPCLDRQSLLFQPLLFHEFGHVLYARHRREMDDLVRALQQAIGQHILPPSSRNDRYAPVQSDQRQAIVDVWYPWVQELFCDATGFIMGGASFLHAFATHVRLLERSDLVQSPLDLRRGTHPVTWLRVKLLTERATAAGFPQEARSISNEWTAVAHAMGVVEDYHGYYDSAIGVLVTQTVEDMLVEAAPRPYTTEEAAGDGWQNGTDTAVRLLNWAWQQYLKDPGRYAAWEAEAVQRCLADPWTVVA
jgi:hypothetical protein